MRKQNNSFRQLGTPPNKVDFSSNDYLGLATSKLIFENTHQFLNNLNATQNGATGSRLLSGNHTLYAKVEAQLSMFHDTEAALIFNSGYTANLGFFSSVPQRGDFIFYDEYIHASIRDGITLSNAKAYKFKHNDLDDLKNVLERHRTAQKNEIYIVTESVFSMDGDSPNLKALSKLCKIENCHLVIDEAHAIGIFGMHGCGLVQHLGIEKEVFARIITFGKAMGCHGAAILSNTLLKEYIINFSRPFIYTTGLPPHTLATIAVTYAMLTTPEIQEKNSCLKAIITHFKAEVQRLKLATSFIESNSAIQCCILPGNHTVKHSAKKLQDKGFQVYPILSPTVPKNQERLRFCLHSYTKQTEVTEALELLYILKNNTYEH